MVAATEKTPRNRRKTVKLLWGLAIVATACFAWQFTYPSRLTAFLAGDTLAVKPSKRNFKLVKPGTELVGKIVLTNMGFSQVTISDVIPSCGCTDVLLADGKKLQFPLQIPPGKSLVIHAIIDTQYSVGQQRVRVAIQYGASKKSFKESVFYFTVLQKPRAHPTLIEAIAVKKTSDQLKFWIGGLRGDSIDVARVTCSDPNVNVTQKELTRSDGVLSLAPPYPGWTPAYEFTLTRLDNQTTAPVPYFVECHLVGYDRPLSVKVNYSHENRLATKPKSLIFSRAGDSRVLEVRVAKPNSTIRITNSSIVEISLANENRAVSTYIVSAPSEIENNSSLGFIELWEIDDTGVAVGSVRIPLSRQCDEGPENALPTSKN